jgi:hypothetical protein
MTFSTLFGPKEQWQILCGPFKISAVFMVKEAIILSLLPSMVGEKRRTHLCYLQISDLRVCLLDPGLGPSLRRSRLRFNNQTRVLSQQEQLLRLFLPFQED